MSQRGSVKGGVLLHLQRFIEESHGKAAWVDLIGRSNPEDRQMLGNLVVAGGWYPVDTWNRVLEDFLGQHYTVPDEGMKRFAAYVAERDLKTVHRMVLRMGTPESVMRRTGSIWRRYFDLGELSATEEAKAVWHLRLDIPLRGPNRLTAGPGVAAWVSLALRHAGVLPSTDLWEDRRALGIRYEHRFSWGLHSGVGATP